MLGTIRNSQTWPSALPPTNTAGPRLRAGLTDSPVTLMNAKCSANRVSPMISPATSSVAVGLVAPRITMMKCG
jgi:hypothetical protein